MSEGRTSLRARAARLVGSTRFERFIISLILLNAVVIGLETSPAIMSVAGAQLHLINAFIVAAFVIEAALKIYAVSPRFTRYFGDGWNLFDFTIVMLSLLPGVGSLAAIARLARLLRVLRLISALPQLRLIVSTLVRSLPGMGHVIMLMGVIFYIYAVLGYHLFHAHDPVHWGSLPLSLLSLFRVVTLEDWTDLMYTAMAMHPMSWIYFVSFVVIGTFIVINLFIAVVINNLEEAKAERLHDLHMPPSRDELLAELRSTKEALDNLETRLATTVGDRDRPSSPMDESS